MTTLKAVLVVAHILGLVLLLAGFACGLGRVRRGQADVNRFMSIGYWTLTATALMLVPTLIMLGADVNWPKLASKAAVVTALIAILDPFRTAERLPSWRWWTALLLTVINIAIALAWH